MTPNKIAFVQPNFRVGPKEFNAYYLPYSVGVIWSYAIADPLIKDNFELTEMTWRRDDIDEVAARLSQNNIVAFSTYVWNKNYNYTVAKKIKNLNPNCLTIFGGPEPAIEDPDFFKKQEFIDLVICYEGEITFRNLLRAYIEGQPYDTINGLLINRNGEAVKTPDARRIETLEEIPSPYLTGLFDKIIEDSPGYNWNGTLETNRGCPFQCTFCDWGSLTYNKVKHFGLERVFDELEWMASRKFDFISITDANFGMFPERDNLIADKIIEVQKKYGFPRTFSVAWAKNQKREVVDIVKKLLSSPAFNQGLTLSVQSLDVDVLENIRRKNMEMSKLEEVFELCEQNNVPTYTELILGLPGETIETWKNNFYKLFDMGNHTGLTVFQAQLLENAEMNQLQRRIHKIESNVTVDYFSGAYLVENDVEEGIQIVIGTKDMPFTDMIDASVFTWYINTLHINGVTTLISRFLNKYSNISYKDFYESLFEFLLTNDWYRSEVEEYRQYIHNWYTKGQILCFIGDIEIRGWNLFHISVLKMHVENRYDYLFDLIEEYITRYNIPNDISADLMKLQRNYFIRYNQINQYPYRLDFDYNLYHYIVLNHPLSKQTVSYEFEFPEDKSMSFPRFLELFYFARRRNFGKALITY